MSKLLLVSVLLASLFIPIAAARDAVAHRGLRKVVLQTAAFMAVYAALLRFIYPRLQ